MDTDHLNVHSPVAGHKLKCPAKKEGHVEDAGTEVPQLSIRRSTRLRSKKISSSCSKDIFNSYPNSSKYTIKSDNRHQFTHKSENNDVLPANTAYMKSSTVVPSFQYHVQSEDGIQLVVDLNLKRPDWLKSMAKALSVCQNHLKPEFESFRKEVEYLGNRNNHKIISPDVNVASDASTDSYVQKEVNTVSCSKCCWSKVDPKPELVHENCKNTKMNEFQFSDILSYPKDLLPSTTEIDQKAAGDNGRSTVDDKERIVSGEETAVSRKEESALMTSASDKGPKRKKRCHTSDNIDGQSHERILRSTKLFGGQIVELDGVVIRRASRLHSK